MTSTDETGWRHGLLRFILTLVAVQALFWTMLALIGESPREYAFMRAHEVRDIYVQQLPGLTPSFHAPDPKSRQSFPLFPDTCHQGYKSPAYQITFNVKIQADIQQGLYIPWVSDNFEAYLNGRRIATPRGQFSLSPSREESRPYVVGIPQGFAQTGMNRMDLVVTRAGCKPYVETAYFGPLTPFKAYEKHMLLLGHYVPIMTAVTGALVALMALCLLPISGYSPQFTSLAAFMAALSLRALTFVWPGKGLDYTTFLTVNYLIHYLSLAAAVFFVQTWAGQPRRHMLWVGGIFTVFCISLVWVWSTGGDLYFLITNMLSPAATIMLTGYTVWSFYRLHHVRPVEARRAIILASLFLTSELYDAFVDILHVRRFIDAANYLPVVLIIAVAGQLTTRGYSLYRKAEAARVDLAAQVAQKEIDIRHSYDILHEQEKINAINMERQRLIRDMHDGIGGQLVSLMLQLKRQDLPREQVHQQVQAAVDDLRLVIDSMDSVGDSLDIALAIFRERLQPRLKSAGIVLDWHNHLEGAVQGFRPQEILHIYRILQEGVTNTMKYADATRVGLSVRPDGDKICIELNDNGSGFDLGAKTTGRRGLSHMEKRAKMLGAVLRIDSAPGKGTSIRFAIDHPI